MTGTIMSIGVESGVIRAETMRNVSFDLSSVLTYDLAALAVGQSVDFDFQSGARSRAINVVVQKRLPSPHPVRDGQPGYLRYMGFEQSGQTRIYSFQQVVPGERTKGYIVTADIDLFARHHVGCQEGPALCLRALTEELSPSGGIENLSLRFSLSDQDLLAHLARRPVSKKSHRPKGSSAAPPRPE